MSTPCSHFDTYFDAWNRPIGALCFLLAPHRRDALDVAFQSFLRMGGGKDPQIGYEDARLLLFRSAIRLCDDYYLKKMHLRTNRKRLEAQSLPFVLTEAHIALLRLPFHKKAALALDQFGFSLHEIADILHISSNRAKRLIADPNIPDWKDALSDMMTTEDEAQMLSDRIYTRFAERSVGVENAIHDFRNTFDRLSPYFALAVLVLFAFSIWFVSH